MLEQVEDATLQVRHKWNKIMRNIKVRDIVMGGDK